MTDKCRSCFAPLLWAETENGRRMPLNPDPVPDGNVVIIRDGVGMAPPVVRVLPAGAILMDNPDTYVSHFATCPRAADHRKPR